MAPTCTVSSEMKLSCPFCAVTYHLHLSGTPIESRCNLGRPFFIWTARQFLSPPWKCALITQFCPLGIPSGPCVIRSDFLMSYVRTVCVVLHCKVLISLRVRVALHFRDLCVRCVFTVLFVTLRGHRLPFGPSTLWRIPNAMPWMSFPALVCNTVATPTLANYAP